MKKYYILEIILEIVALISFIAFLIYKKDEDILEYKYYIYTVVYIGIIVPLIHLVVHMIKQIKINKYLGYKFDPIMSYFCMLVFGFIYLIMVNISSTIFYKINVLLWILIPFIYVVLIYFGLKLEKKDNKKIDKSKLGKN